MYNWQQSDWPAFRYDVTKFEGIIFDFAGEAGYTSGLLKGMPDDTQLEAIMDTMALEAIKTSEIEGEYLDRGDVVSSIRNQLGLNAEPEPVKDRKSRGAGELVAAVRQTYAAPLTEAMLFGWHRMLLPQNFKINTGAWRKDTEPMQVVSGPVGKETVHFEAPPAAHVPEEMNRFIDWFQATAPGGIFEIIKAPVRAAIAHLYFETIHPFEDGNGRIGRAVAEKALSQTAGRPVLLSISQIIEADRKRYYQELKKAQQSNEITEWITYFVGVILQALVETRQLADFILKKARFFDRFRETLNDRQTKLIQKMLDAGPGGFKGGMSAAKYASITKTSKATATRDLQNLLAIGAFVIEGGGRSTRYRLNI